MSAASYPIFNFSPGPSALPLSVVQQAQAEMLNWAGTGHSVLEISHRNPLFLKVLDELESTLRRLLNIPDHYVVLFGQGGAVAQNALVPLNLLENKTKADYLVTGRWSEKSYHEAKRYGDVHCAANNAGDPYQLPEVNDWNLRSNTHYLHYCDNETVHGVEFPKLPQASEGSCLVSDMSSNLLTRAIEIDQFGVIYAGAQKNLSCAGMTLIIVRKSLLGRANTLCPDALNWTNMAQMKSMYNTPPVYPLYLANLVLRWLDRNGGVPVAEEKCLEKSELLYRCLDQSDFYCGCVAPSVRSRVNVTFTLKQPQLEPLFLEEAAQEGLLYLKGHKAVGGLRASLYNAMPIDGVHALTRFMHRFEKKYG